MASLWRIDFGNQYFGNLAPIAAVPIGVIAVVAFLAKRQIQQSVNAVGVDTAALVVWQRSRIDRAAVWMNRHVGVVAISRLYRTIITNQIRLAQALAARRIAPIAVTIAVVVTIKHLTTGKTFLIRLMRTFRAASRLANPSDA